MAGLTATGFVKKTFQEIVAEKQEKYTAILGNVKLTDDSVVGQLIYIESEREAQIWDLLEAVNNSQYTDTAQGISLNGACAYLGIRRLAATATTVDVLITAVNQTVIPLDSSMTALFVESIFSINEETVVTNENCIAARLTVDEVVVGNVYSIKVNNHANFSYTAINGDTEVIIINHLKNLVNAGGLPVVASLLAGQLQIFANRDLSNKFIKIAIYVIENMQISEVDTIAEFVAADKGKINIPAGVLNNIQTPIGGWVSGHNPDAGNIGRDLETDEEFRTRFEVSKNLSGSGTYDAIRARLLNRAGVISVSIIENLDLHNYQCLIVGGDDLDIAKTIWASKPLGIETVGSTEITILDSENKEHIIKFSRPVPLYIYANIELTKTSDIEDDILTIKSDIVNNINALNAGETVLIQSLFKSIYKLPNITNADVTIGSSLIDGVVPDLGTINLNVLSSQIATTDNVKIVITEA